MNTIKWLLGLEQGKLMIAMLLVAISALFLQNQVKETQKDALNTAFRTEMIKREDSCEAQKLRSLQEANARMQEFLTTLLERSKKAERTIDSTVHYNKKVIDSTTSNVRKVKNILNTSIHVFPTHSTRHY